MHDEAGAAQAHQDFVTGVVEQWQRERPDLDSWPSGIAGRILRLSTFIRRTGENLVAPLGLSWETFEMIAALRRQGPPFAMNPTAIYKSVMLTSGAMTARLDRAEEAGLITRSSDPNDRRGTIISLTKKGKKLADESIELYFKSLGEIWGPIGERGLAQVTQLLAALLAITESRTKTGSLEGSTTERAKLPRGAETKSARRGKV
jgi:DNA-binding MarR family transcriptional regulator